MSGHMDPPLFEDLCIGLLSGSAPFLMLCFTVFVYESAHLSAIKNEDLSQDASEREPGKKTTRAKVQAIMSKNGPCDVQPEFWGITIKQCKELLMDCRQDPEWDDTNSLAVMVRDYVIPKTRGHGLGYALLLNQGEPKEVNVMVSHCWQENAKDFVSTLSRTVSETDVMFICAFSLYQPEDGHGPSIQEQLGSSAKQSPFRRVLDHIQASGQETGILWRWRGTLCLFPRACLLHGICLFALPMIISACVQTPDGCASFSYPAKRWTYTNHEAEYNRKCLIGSVVSVILAIVLQCMIKQLNIYSGRFVAVPNHQTDLYTRLWCVYEIYIASCLGIPMELAKTLAPCGSCSSRDATCSTLEDQARIRNEIEQTTMGYAGNGYDRIDKAVRKLARSSTWSGLWYMGASVHTFCFCATATARCLLADVIDEWGMLGVVIGIWCSGALTFSILNQASQVNEGLLTRPGIKRIILLPAGLGLLCSLLFFVTWTLDRGWTNTFAFGALGALGIGLIQSASSMAIIAVCFSNCSKTVRKQIGWMAMYLVPVAIALATFLVLIASIGSERPLIPWIVVYSSTSAWAIGRLQSIWALSVAWGVRIVDNDLTHKGEQRHLPGPHLDVVVVDISPSIEEGGNAVIATEERDVPNSHDKNVQPRSFLYNL